MEQHILAEECQGIFTITFNRPKKRNAISVAMYEQLIAHFQYASRTPEIHCLLIKGDEACFTAGNDFSDKTDGEEITAFKFIEQIATFNKPIIAAVAGPAVGIGTTLLLQCDMVFAASNSKFCLPFVQLGICLEAGSSLLLPLKLGYNKAFELAVLGQPFSAAQAHQYGIVNEVCQPDELFEKALNAAQLIAKLPSDAVQTNRRLMRQSMASAMPEVISNENAQVTRLIKTPYCQSILIPT